MRKDLVHGMRSQVSVYGICRRVAQWTEYRIDVAVSVRQRRTNDVSVSLIGCAPFRRGYAMRYVSSVSDARIKRPISIR